MITALYYELYYRMTKASRLHDESGIERKIDYTIGEEAWAMEKRSTTDTCMGRAKDRISQIVPTSSFIAFQSTVVSDDLRRRP